MFITLSNGTHTVGVIFDNGSFSTGATVTILKSSHGSVTDPTIPPEALTTIKYEFYKDYPDVVIIPIAMNGASEITEMKIGTEVVPEDMYQLQDGAIIIKSEYLSKLAVGKYRILPTFNDAANTTISTGITQNVGDLLASPQAVAILNNCDFVLMLNQSPIDKAQLAQMLNISPVQLSYITNSDPGQGLIYTGKSIVPFMDKFPVNTKLYRVMTTKPDDLKN